MTPAGQRAFARLTETEKRTLVALCESRTNPEIAAQMGTTEQVIKNRLNSIYEKTSTSNRLHLAIWAFYHGLVKCPCIRCRCGD